MAKCLNEALDGLKDLLKDYEARPGQEQMAHSVYDALSDQDKVIIEAGTGIGKSLAYLIPLFLLHEHLPKPLVISTSTINLQEQLLSKDIPLVQELLGLKNLYVVLGKGKSNYLCPKKLQSRLELQGSLFELDDKKQELHKWAISTETGDKADCAYEPNFYEWRDLSCHSDTCQVAKCPRPSQCFVLKARKRLESADVIVVNHHMLLSDAALKQELGSLLPEYSVLVVDEAHRVLDAAVSCFSQSLSPEDILALHARIAELLEHQIAGNYASDLQTWLSVLAENAHSLKEQASALGNALGQIALILEGLEREQEKNLALSCLALQRRIDFFEHQDDSRYAYWDEQTAHGDTVLKSSPVETAELLHEAVFAQTESLILTSASISVNGSLDYFSKRVGLTPDKHYVFDSPFDYPNVMRLKLSDDPLLEPRHPEYLQNLAAYCQELILKSNGGSFVLFTNAEQMRGVHEQICSNLQEAGIEVLIQGQFSKNLILKHFQSHKHLALFALDSFWTGVDVKGEHLRQVIICKLPFAVFNSPWNKAIAERIEQQGGNAFRDFSLPEAVLKFKQGVGRLIRSQNDFGEVIVLDPRLKQKFYGKSFLKSIPECPVEVLKLDLKAIFDHNLA